MMPIEEWEYIKLLVDKAFKDEKIHGSEIVSRVGKDDGCIIHLVSMKMEIIVSEDKSCNNEVA